MMYSEILRQIGSLPIPSNGFTFMRISESFWGYDENMNISFAIESSSLGSIPLFQMTRYLKLYSNVECNVYDNIQSKKMKLNVITLCDNDAQRIETFVNLSYSFEKQNDDNSFLKFFSYLIILFSSSNKTTELEMQGFFGELFTMTYFLEKFEYDLSSKYQSVDKMKFDFSLNEKKRIEVKTTQKSSHIFHFRLDQLNVMQYDIKIVTLFLQKDDQGMSLYDLIEKCKSTFNKNFMFLLYIERHITNWSSSELRNLKYNYQHAYDSLQIFDALSIPRIQEKTNDGIFNVEFDSDLSGSSSLESRKIILWLNTEYSGVN